MSVIFEATIKENGIGGWYIELKDTVSQTTEVCNDLTQFEEKIEAMGQEYGGQIDEVKWGKDENVSPEHMYEVQAQMARINEEINK